ncbi:MAG TPA: adenylate/guanylate cyclase domain-containing protein [Candidatus Lustribacter sp.]|nr:adenylate/guanylate cyclase domain-containing protein [Candidatus Lustribacter sp.]
MVILTLLIGVSMTVLFYSRMKDALFETADLVFDRTGALIARVIEDTRSELFDSLEVATYSKLATATTFRDRVAAFGVLAAVLRANPSIVAAYVGYPDGDIILLRPLSAAQRTVFRAPPRAAFVLQTVERPAVRGSYTFYDRGLHELAARVVPGYRLDPRARPWYRVRLNQRFVSDPYEYFTTKEIGFTNAVRASSGAVFAADLTLAELSTIISEVIPTPHSIAAVVDQSGNVLSYAGPPVANLNAGRVQKVADFRSEPLSAAFKAWSPTEIVQGSFRDRDGQNWLYRISPSSGRVGSARSAFLIVPEAELLASAQRARTQALILSIIFIVLLIPVSFVLGGYIAGPIRRLRNDAAALRELDFSERPSQPSHIDEIAEFSETFGAMRRHIKQYNDASTRFVPREFLEQLDRSNIISLQLGDCALREMTIMFSDIRSFTTLSGTMTPQATFEFLNSYLREMSPIIREHHGFIDKYIGDGMMGLFPRAPDAVGAAVAMQRQLVAYNRSRVQAGHEAISVGIGFHCGELMMGTIGEEQRFETTVIADAVNIASRLESLTKHFRALILISGEVVERITPQAYHLRRLCNVQAKGATHAVSVYEVCDADAVDLREHKIRTLADFERARVAYETGDFASAERLFTDIANADRRDGAAEYFRERAATLRVTAALVSWDGIERMESK